MSWRGSLVSGAGSFSLDEKEKERLEKELLQEEDSGAKNLPGAGECAPSQEWAYHGLFGLPLLEQLTRKEVALGCVGEEEVGSESGGETQERAGAKEGVVGPVSKGEEAGEEG